MVARQHPVARPQGFHRRSPRLAGDHRAGGEARHHRLDVGEGHRAGDLVPGHCRRSPPRSRGSADHRRSTAGPGRSGPARRSRCRFRRRRWCRPHSPGRCRSPRRPHSVAAPPPVIRSSPSPAMMVSPVAAEMRVVAVAAVEQVGPAAAVKDVVAIAAAQRVVAGAARQRVVAVPRPNRLSLPVPPSRLSLPASPVAVSSPAPARMVSLPSPP